MPATERVERIQSGEDRRRGILSVLRRSGSPVVGSDLARRLDVSRQVIVQDIALLRARGHKILATPRGYLMLDAGPRASTQVACRHTSFEEEVAQLLPRLQDNLKELGAEVIRVENWGKRRLAHDIKKQREGTYAVLEVSAEPPMVKEFERQLKLNENILRFLSTRVPVRKKARPAPTGEVLEEVR